jgi:hypothetical protein
MKLFWFHRIPKQMYRGYSIKYQVKKAPGTGSWAGYAQIQFYEQNGSFRNIPVNGSTDTSATKEEAELEILQTAKRWVDRRFAE